MLYINDRKCINNKCIKKYSIGLAKYSIGWFIWVFQMNFLANPIHGIMSFKEPLCGDEVKGSFVRGCIWSQPVQGRCVWNCNR